MDEYSRWEQRTFWITQVVILAALAWTFYEHWTIQDVGIALGLLFAGGLAVRLIFWLMRHRKSKSAT